MTDRPTPASTPLSKRIGGPILRVEGLGKDFLVGSGLRRRRVQALSDVSFELHRGEIVALVGESGSGKSTVLRILARLLQPSRGRILLDGRDLLREEPRRASLAYRGRVQMIFQDPFGSLNPVQRIRYQLARPLLRHGHAQSRRQAEQQVEELLHTVGLLPATKFADKYPDQMSGGQRQRVSIARALAVRPQIILADEPTSMLDVSLRMGILNLLDELKTRQGIGYLYVTHDLGSARYLADRILVMYGGRVVESGPAEQLLDGPAHPYTKLLLEALPDPARELRRPLAATSSAPNLRSNGCPFAARCPERLAVCESQAPPLVELGNARQAVDTSQHDVRCHARIEQ